MASEVAFYYYVLDVGDADRITVAVTPQMALYVRDAGSDSILGDSMHAETTYTVDLSSGQGPYWLVVEQQPTYVAKNPFDYAITLAEGNRPLAPAQAEEVETASVTPAPANGDTGTTVSTSCTVSADSNVNQRSGPGTSFGVSGTLTGAAQADGQATGSDGIVWWRLSSGGWVRSDVVAESGDCAALPVAQP
jgi:hypothetical protein